MVPGLNPSMIYKLKANIIFRACFPLLALSHQVIDARTEFLQYVSEIVQMQDALSMESPFSNTITT